MRPTRTVSALKGTPNNLSNLTSSRNGKGRKHIHVCGLPIAEDVRFGYQSLSIFVVSTPNLLSAVDPTSLA
ncbi:MAG: hypothetical protein RLZZ360_759 [Candidatus Parcubacteria bacterium]|jgi:hypothetical protein